MADHEKDGGVYDTEAYYGQDSHSVDVDDEKMLQTLGIMEDTSNGTVKRDLKQRHIVSLSRELCHLLMLTFSRL